MDERLHRVERELRWIKRYTASVAIILGAMLMAAFQQADRSRFTEIDVERLNIVEKDGTLRLAIANPERVPPIMFYGKEYPGLRGGSAPGAAGMIYFNEEGSEVGGYLWRGRTLEDGSHTAAGFLTFDQYNQGETLTLTYVDRNGQRRAGLSILDQPGGSIQPALDPAAWRRSTTCADKTAGPTPLGSSPGRIRARAQSSRSPIWKAGRAFASWSIRLACPSSSSSTKTAKSRTSFPSTGADRGSSRGSHTRSP
jgi:hypothetical protein